MEGNISVKVTAKLDGTGYPADPITAKGFALQVGDYSSEHQATVHLNFAEGIALLNDLVAAAREHRDAVTVRLGETGRLAAAGDAIAAADAI